MRHFDNLQYGWRVGTDEGGRKSNVSGRLFAFFRVGIFALDFNPNSTLCFDYKSACM